MPTYILFESALGYALFQRHQQEEIAVKQITSSMNDFSKFSDMVKFVAFAPFESPEHGLENVNNISEGILHPFLLNFLEMNLGSGKKVKLGVSESKLGGAIQEELQNVTCFADDSSAELIRGIRMHLHKFIKSVKKGDIEKAQLGLGHAYSRAKVKFNVNKADNMIIQAIALLDQLDKDLNTFSMRIREWYSWHFPELNKMVKDNVQFAKLVKLIGDKSNINDEMIDAINDIVKDENLAKEIIASGRASMGVDVSEYDMLNIDQFAKKVVDIGEYRKDLYEYLQAKMHTVAPNLTCLLGEQVGARLIAHAGSMINLSKYPASTVQILGAEKALFRALKTRGNTPKYGLIYHSTFIGRASKQNKGKISRYLANKCSIAVRIDSFQDFPTSKFGEKLRDQVEERLNFYENGGEGINLTKNVDLMREVAKEVAKEQKKQQKETPKKRKREEKDEDAMQEDNSEEDEPKKKKSKKDKKKKDKKKDESESEEETPKKSKKDKKKEESDDEDETPKKKSKKDKKKKSKKEESSDDEKMADSFNKESKNESESEEETPKKKSKKDKKKEEKKESDDEDETPKKKSKKDKKKEEKQESDDENETPKKKSKKAKKTSKKDKER
jgi:nucleolar protein 56